MSQPSDALTLSPIGYLRSEQEHKFQLPPQPESEASPLRYSSQDVGGLIELLPRQNYDVALRDLDGFSRIWLIWWFHKNTNWRPTTMPPRGRTGRKGTFSTRSPYRPNPLAMSCVKLLAIEGHKIYIGPHDLVADTPILDIKPYMPRFDAFPDERTGWFEEMERELEESPNFSVEFRTAAPNLELKATIEETLGQDPFPHRTRRIIELAEGFRLSCGDWRVFYSVNGNLISVDRVEHREGL